MKLISTTMKEQFWVCTPSAPVVFYTDDGTSFYRNVCEMIANILAIILLLKLNSGYVALFWRNIGKI